MIIITDILSENVANRCQTANSIFQWAYSRIKVEVKHVTGLECPRGFQEVKVPRFHDNGT